jgi:hypothetical protein
MPPNGKFQNWGSRQSEALLETSCDTGASACFGISQSRKNVEERITYIECTRGLQSTGSRKVTVSDKIKVAARYEARPRYYFFTPHPYVDLEKG